MAEKKVTQVIALIHICKGNKLINAYSDIATREIVTNTLAIFAELLSKHSGSIIKTAGGELVCTFPNAKKAVQSIFEIQEAIQHNLALAKQDVSFKSGIHYGEMVFKENDVTGPAVRIASHLITIARVNQLLLTASIMNTLPMEIKSEMHRIGPLSIPNKLMKVEVFEKVWFPEAYDEEEHTMIYDDSVVDNPSALDQLVLKFKGRNFILGANRPSFLLGRDKKSDITLEDGSVSREHARIKYEKGKFTLIDHSTNGTYILTESKENFCVHQEELHLRGKGVICAGKKITRNHPELIYYFLK